MSLNIKKSQLIQLAVFFLTLLTLSFSYYLQWYGHLQPCLLCIVQRTCLWAIAVLAFVAIFLSRKKTLSSVFSLLIFLVAILGVLTAGRQVYLQHYAATLDLPCLPNWHLLWNMMPVEQFLQAVMIGSSDCSLVTWSFMGLSLAGWGMIFFGWVAVVELLVLCFF